MFSAPIYAHVYFLRTDKKKKATFPFTAMWHFGLCPHSVGDSVSALSPTGRRQSAIVCDLFMHVIYPPPTHTHIFDQTQLLHDSKAVFSSLMEIQTRVMTTNDQSFLNYGRLFPVSVTDIITFTWKRHKCLQPTVAMPVSYICRTVSWKLFIIFLNVECLILHLNLDAHLTSMKVRSHIDLEICVDISGNVRTLDSGSPCSVLHLH